MNKKGLTDYVAEEAGITKKDANALIGVVMGGISEGLTTEGKVTLVGFGTFSIVTRKARMARNPKTGEPTRVTLPSEVRPSEISPSTTPIRAFASFFVIPASSAT